MVQFPSQLYLGAQKYQFFLYRKHLHGTIPLTVLLAKVHLRIIDTARYFCIVDKATDNLTKALYFLT